MEKGKKKILPLLRERAKIKSDTPTAADFSA